METLLALLVGVGLAASCGFRVFVPLLTMSVAVKAGHLELADGWQWVGEWPALIALAVATTIEVVGYFVPWIDNLLDSLATPAAVVAGIVVTAACVADMSPLMQWSTAVIAGGGAAGCVQAGTVLLRGASTSTTGGFGNFLIAIVELVASSVLSILTIVVPVVATLVLLLVVAWSVRLLLRWRRKKTADALP